MESIETRNALTKVFENLDLIVNVEFGKSLINERLGRDSIVLNLGENIFVFEKLGDSRILKKMKDLTFHSYVMENFKYDISELYSIQLEERDAKIKELDSEKSAIEDNLEKLEKSISQIEEALKDHSLSAEYQDKLNELKMSIEKNVNALKNQYILVDQSKKKF
jgi:peptidoglycan hydrolase CwlO-like protein